MNGINEILKLMGYYPAVNILPRIIIAIIVLLAGHFLRHVFVKIIVKLLLSITKKTKTEIDDMLVISFEKPAKVLISGLAVYAALLILPLPITVHAFINFLLRLFFIIIVFWFLFRAADIVIYLLEKFINKTEKKANPALMGLFGKTLKILIVTFEIFILISMFGYDISGIVAGFGLGGLAISLAAKDAAANLLGSITIMIDKTYSIGDWIQTEKVEGIVEEIGFRSTKIRTFSNSVVSVPNSIMSNEPVINWSKMGKRRASFRLNIPLNTPSEKIKQLTARIREMLVNDPDILNDNIVVNFESFGEGTLVILITFFTKTTAYQTYLNVVENANLKILGIFEELGVPIAVPSRRIVMENQHNEVNQQVENYDYKQI